MTTHTLHPSLWKIQDVIEWATTVTLSESAIQALKDNEVDGATLITLTKDELRDDLEIRSLAARRYIWGKIEQLRAEEQIADEATALQVHLAEIDNLPINNPDESAGAFRSTDSTVVKTLRSDAIAQQQILADRFYCFSLQNTYSVGQQVFEDTEAACKEQERLDAFDIVCASDRAYALSLHQGRRQAPAASNEVKSLFRLCIEACARYRIDVYDALNTGKIHPISKRNVFFDFDSAEEKDEPSMKPPYIVPKVALKETRRDDQGKSSVLDMLPRLQCIVCYSTKRSFVLACNHAYCTVCMKELLQQALKDSDLIPLRCCELPIDMTVSTLLLNSRGSNILLERTEEKAARNKMYCPSCSKFIDLDRVDLTESITFYCYCGIELCSVCRTASHAEVTCQANLDVRNGSDKPVLDLGEANGWKQCPNCAALIELTYGCNHMKCSFCSYHFCYQCCNVWDLKVGRCSSGRCAVWEEDRLLEAGRARVEANQLRIPQRAAVGQNELFRGIAQAPLLPIPRIVPQHQIRAAMNAIRGNEQCEHVWVRRYMRGTCENCSFQLHSYGMVCQGQCQSTVCYVCANHRLPRRGWR
jgi:hypothetical protein